MEIKELLNLKLIITDNYSLSIYSLALVLLILVLTYVVLKVIQRVFKSLIKHQKLEAASGYSIFLIIKYIIWVLILIVSLDTLGLKISILLASFAALLVGVGLGLQQLFNDISSGIVLLVEQSIRVGDIIELDDGRIGKVMSINLRTSVIKMRDDIVAIIPNSKLVNDIIVNWSHIDKSTRFYVQVGVAYGSNVDLVRSLLLKSLINHPDIEKNPAPFVRFEDFGNSSLDFQVFFWVTKSFIIETIKSDVRFQINKLFAENKITIPFPQSDVYIKEYPNLKSEK
ncbi:MAG: mechanosensitive ion channel [Bacteroidetes bacterium]|nr:mechanosensitive ion channel [Bacteroidota bacterium]